MKEIAKKLDKDIVVFDLETTGIDTQSDQIIQFHGTRIEKKTGKTKELNFLCKPTCNINPKASEVNGFTAEKLAKQPRFCHFVKKIIEFFKDADVAGYNNNKFDNEILQRQMRENGVPDFMKNRLSFDAFEVYKTHINKKLLGCLEFYCGKIGEGAHDAKNDVNFTIEIINAQLQKEKLTPTEIVAKLSESSKDKKENELDRYLRKEGDVWILNFSKHKDKKLCDCEKSFLTWVLDKDFPDCLKQVIKNHLTSKSGGR